MAKIETLVEHARPHLEAGERIDAVVMGTYETRQLGAKATKAGVLIATDRRVLFFGKKIGGYDLESFPYPNISSFEQNKGMMGHSFRFAAAGNNVWMKWIQKGDITGFAALMRERAGQRPAASQAQLAATASDPMAALRQLEELRAAGLISPEEYTSKRAEILSRL